MDHIKIIRIVAEINDRIKFLMSEIPDNYNGEVIMKQLALTTMQFASFAAYVADDMSRKLND